MTLRNTLSRVRWNVVLGIFVIILLIIVAMLLFIITNPLAPKYKIVGDIQMRSWVDPNRIEAGGVSTVWLDIINTGTEDMVVDIQMKTYDPKLVFIYEPHSTNQTQTIKDRIYIGPGESRKIGFNIKLSPLSYSGRYGINVMVRYGDRWSTEDEVYLTAYVTSSIP